jgi:prepilin-type N-terminal cleavage/methylation domain-containing protein
MIFIRWAKTVRKAMMMSLTGIKAGSKRAFTLIEVMVAVAVLSFGLVMVYQAFFVVLDTFNYGADYLEVSPWMDEKIWLAQDSIMRKGVLEDNSTNGELNLRNKKFTWELRNSVVDGTNNLIALTLDVYWKEGKRPVQASRSGYAKYYER